MEIFKELFFRTQKFNYLNGKLGELVTTTLASKGYDNCIAVKLGNLAIVQRRHILANNASGVQTINIKLPYKYKSAALVDSAYGMNYIDTSASNGCPANILFSELTYPDDATYIRGHVNYTTKASYLCYNYIVIGLIE